MFSRCTLLLAIMLASTSAYAQTTETVSQSPATTATEAIDAPTTATAETAPETTNPVAAAPTPAPSAPPAAQPATPAPWWAPPPVPHSDATSVTLPSGLIYQDIKVGDGEETTTSKQLAIHYTVRLDNGEVADSSRTKMLPTPFMFQPGSGQAIAGMDEGVRGMRVGGRRLLTVPAKLGYGERGSGNIPPNATLHFDVELVEIK